MLLILLLILPIIGLILAATGIFSNKLNINIKWIKFTAITTSITNIFVCLLIYILYDFTSNQFQFVEEHHEISSWFNFYFGLDGLSLYFVLLTTIITPVSLLSNWSSISTCIKYYLNIILLLETLLLVVFLVLDIFLYYVFFESILAPFFILIGMFGSNNRITASFYLFLYTLLGSLFLLLSILTMSSIMGFTDFDALFKINYNYLSQLFLFYGVFIAFAVKTPTIFLNTWLLKAHVESPLAGSIILAAIVLKLSLYGIFRLILPLLPKASIVMTFIVYIIGIITIMYASLSTLRTVDVKELIAYSSVSHAAVYLMAVFSNSIQGIEGGILLGLAHGLTSSALFICVGGVLYDRSLNRLIYIYRGLAQVIPLFSILFFVLSLSNSGVPLTLNFLGEFMSLYGIFERLPILGVFASWSIIFSAAYSIYMYNKIAFAGSYSKYFTVYIPDLFKREYTVLFTLVIFIVFLGIYPSCILDGLLYSVSSLIYLGDCVVYCIDNMNESMNNSNLANSSNAQNQYLPSPENFSKAVMDNCGVTQPDNNISDTVRGEKLADYLVNSKMLKENIIDKGIYDIRGLTVGDVGLNPVNKSFIIDAIKKNPGTPAWYTIGPSGNETNLTTVRITYSFIDMIENHK